MDTLSTEVTQSILEYLDTDSSFCFRSVDKKNKKIIDTHPKWSIILKKQINEKYKQIIFNQSIGMSAIIIKNSMKIWSCVSCNQQCDNYVHPFYGVPVCKYCCEKVDFFKTMTIPQACKEFFIDKSATKDEPVFQKTSSSKVIMYNNAKKCGEKVHGIGGLKELTCKRTNRKKILVEKRKRAVSVRLEKMKKKTWLKINSNYSRVDKEFMEIGRLIKLMHRHSLRGFIMGDFLEFKLNCRFDIDVISERLVELGCMLTFCREQGILLSDHLTINGHIHYGFNVKSIFKNHILGGTHFYVHIIEYMRSHELIYRRSKDVDEYIKNHPTMTSGERRLMSLKLCTEEGIPMDISVFENFISKGEGNPVYLARENRKMGFLLDRGLDEEVDYCVNVLEMDVENSRIEAKRHILNMFGGFPIFSNIFVDDSIPPLYI